MPANYEPHLRLTMAGTLPGPEQFSCNLSLVPQGPSWTGALEAANLFVAINELVSGMSGQNWNDLVADCVAFWGRLESHIHQTAALTSVKLVGIASNGTYASMPREALVNQPGFHAGVPLPNQIARKITLETDADLGRVKGGFYLPGLDINGYDHASNSYSQQFVEEVRDSVVQLVNDLSNNPGFDVDGLRVVVASQGRHGPNGIVRVPRGNHEVKRVTVGRRPDVQRRRANHIPERYVTDANVDQA